MIRTMTACTVLALVAVVPMRQARRKNNTLGGAIIGGAAGAIIGGAATGKAGGAVAGGIIGAAAGAMLGSQMEPRHRGYYWYKGRCWLKRARRQLLSRVQPPLPLTAVGAGRCSVTNGRKRAAFRPPSYNATREEPLNGQAIQRRRPA